MGNIDSNNPDLSAFKRAGGKLLTWHGIHDEAIPVQGTMRYYESVVKKVGGLAKVQNFYKLFIVPGVGHATPNGSANPEAHPPTIDNQAYYQAIVDWVEKGVAPGRMDLTTPKSAPLRASQPVCPYPQKAVYRSGDPRAADSFVCG